MKFRLEHMLPHRFRYARVHLEVGSASVFFSLDGASADWHASIGDRKRPVAMSDKEYTRLRASAPATEMVDDDGRILIVKNASGYEERWRKPQWVLMNMRRPHGGERDSAPGV